ncbi:MAG: GNAT family N-acetyltransferase [Treponema sp.]|nr:GNAT family N-acetyltransferase [Treponema sp.]
MISIQALTDTERARAIAFLQPFERFCVPLSAKLQAGTVPAFAAVDDSGQWHGVCTFSAAGQLFHCLPVRKDNPREALYDALRRWFSEQRTHAFFSINGESHGTAMLVKAAAEACGVTPVRRQRYDFLRSPASGAYAVANAVEKPLSVMAHPVIELPVLPDGGKIVRCTPSMAETLFPLQSAYEKEEVLFNLATYSEEVSLLSFKKNLREQVVYCFLLDGKPVAKAGTNAQGLYFVQLGGVYTVPAARGHGYAAALVQRIVADFAARKKQSVLFVKPENSSAQRLYARCGFTRFGSYETVYY